VDEEDPLEHLAVVVRLGRGVERELALLVVVLAEVEEDRGRLEDVEVAAVRVDDRGAACGSSGIGLGAGADMVNAHTTVRLSQEHISNSSQVHVHGTHVDRDEPRLLLCETW
jgi:hypothetical protein